MNHSLYKMLFDQNPDGSVSYSREDLEKITEEINSEQAAFKALLGDSFKILLEEIQKRIDGIAEFAYGDKNQASQVYFNYANTASSPYDIATVHIYLWGDKLNQIKIFHDGEKIDLWEFSSQSTSHQLIFTRKVSNDLATKASSLWLMFNS